MSHKMQTPWSLPFSVPEMSYSEAETWAHDTGFFGNIGDPLLETVVDMLDELNRPDASYDIIQIAGTNGKTSTARYTAALLAGEHKRVGLYTSPELVEMRERMEVAGKPVAYEAFAHGISVAVETGKRVNAQRTARGLDPYRVTEFDVLTVAACAIFAEAHVDVAVLEVGLGGRWDATTATHPCVTCVTGIGLDHIHILGDTLEAIAGEKAAVIKQGQTCILGAGTATPASVEDVFLERCAKQHVTPILVRPESYEDAPGELEGRELRRHDDLLKASFHITRRPERIGGTLVLDVTTPRATYRGLCAVKPAYQAANIACALTVCEAYLGRVLVADRLVECVSLCPTPGRFSVLSGSPLHLIDAAHNPQSIRSLMQSLAEIEPEVQTRPTLLCAVLRDKDVEHIVELVAHEFPRCVVCATSSPRALPASELAQVFQHNGVDVAATYATVDEACTALQDESYSALGSITLAGDVASWHQRQARECPNH